LAFKKFWLLGVSLPATAIALTLAARMLPLPMSALIDVALTPELQAAGSA
jgi:hypothetical protein